MHARSTLLAIAASVGYAAALSTGCTTEVGILALGDLGNCLQLTSLLPLVSGSGSIVSSLNTYLASLCASSTTTCSDSTLTSASSSVTSSCSSDLSSGGTTAAEVEALLLLINDYPQFYAAGCSKNSTTGDYCIVDVLTAVQTTLGTNLTLSSVVGILGNSSSLASVASSGELCTGCVSGIYYEALQANSSIATTTFGKGLTSQCGSSFGTTAPNTTTTTTTTSASSTATGSSTTSAAERLGAFGGAVVLAGSTFGAVALGFAAIL